MKVTNISKEYSTIEFYNLYKLKSTFIGKTDSGNYITITIQEEGDPLNMLCSTLTSDPIDLQLSLTQTQTKTITKNL